jgi:MscS family membrane protein
LAVDGRTHVQFNHRALGRAGERGHGVDPGGSTLGGLLTQRRRRGFVPAVAVVALLATALPGAAADATHPLEPPDTFSPRGTIGTLERSIDETWASFSAHDPSWRRSLQKAVRCLDLRDLPPEVAQQVGTERAVLLKEVLDRIEQPSLDDIPGRAEVEGGNLLRWTLPHTEITLVRMAEGERAGEFLFSSRTVERLPEFYATVRHLPYEPGRQGGHYEEIRSGVLTPIVGSLAARLPAWTRVEIGNQLLWQWAVVLVGMLLGIGLAVEAFRVGRRWGRLEPPAARRRLAPFLFPLAVIVLVRIELEVMARFIRLAGRLYYAGRLVLLATAHLAIAWLVAVALTALGEAVIRHTRAGRRALNAQLVRLSFRILTIVVVAGYLFVAAEKLGLPVPALVAGLGVGGLAVALATQGTLENLIGGLILYADQPVRVGDFFRFGDQVGSVEDIGIRSARIRTLNRTVIALPNSDLVKMPLENFSRRDRTRLAATLRLRMETTPDQLRYLLSRLEEMLAEHPRLSGEGRRVRFLGFGEYSLDVEIVALSPTTNWDEFLAVRQDVFLRAMSLVEEAGTRLAVPVAVELEGRDAPPDEDRARQAAERTRRWREEGRLRVTEYPPSPPGEAKDP